MSNRIVLAFFSCACIFLAGCSHNGIKALSTHTDAPYKDRAVASDFRYSWTLPKTIFDVDATWTFQSCEVQKGDNAPLVSAKVDVQLTPHAVPDLDIGYVYLDAAKTNSFWQDHAFDVKTAATTHLLQSFNSTATDQTGTILGNFLSGAVKIADYAVATAAAFHKDEHVSPSCGPLKDVPGNIRKKQAELKGISDQTSERAKKLVAEISALQQLLVIKLETLTVDPGYKDGNPRPINDGVVDTLNISIDALQKNGWLEHPNNEQFGLTIRLVFSKALPKEFATDHIQPVTLLRDSLWREVAYVPVEVIDQTGKPVGKQKVLPFAQFGAPRTLPMDAPMFGKADWTIAFNDSGEVTEAKWGSTATGIGISQTFLNAASAASGIATDASKAPPLDKKTQEMQNQNAQLQAIVTNQTVMQQCLALKAKGQVDSCP